MLKIKLKLIDWSNKFKIKRVSEKTGRMPGTTTVTGDLMAIIFKITILGFFGMLVLFPFFYMISASLMTHDEIIDKEIRLTPEKAIVENYKKAFADHYWDALFLTASITLISIVMKIVITMFLGYAFSLPKWRGKKLLWYFLLSLLMLPEVALITGQYKLITKFEWTTGTSLIMALSVPFVASIFSGIMFRNAFLAIPDRTKEASMIDGVSGLKYFLKIAVPMVTPTTWTVGILTAFAAWNSYMWPSILLASQGDDYQVMSTWLFTTGKSPDPEIPELLVEIRLAAAVIAILPMFIAYFAMRARIMRAISRQGSAIKG